MKTIQTKPDISKVTLKLNQHVEVEFRGHKATYMIVGAGQIPVTLDWVLTLKNHKPEHPETIKITLPGNRIELFKENEDADNKN